MFKKLNTQILTVVLLLIFSVSAFADQAVYITKAQATKAVELLKKQKKIKHYCPLCDDKGVYEETVESVESSPTGYENTWEVRIKLEGEGLDLAYVYFQTKDGKWKNVAKELGIKVENVPIFLPKNK